MWKQQPESFIWKIRPRSFKFLQETLKVGCGFIWIYLHKCHRVSTTGPLCTAGNTFSSLTSTPFDWTLISDKDHQEGNFVDAHSILRFEIQLAVALPQEWPDGVCTCKFPYVHVSSRATFRIITFRDSSYDTPDHIEAMELEGLQGDTILVEGVKTGSANVQVRLKESIYKVWLVGSLLYSLGMFGWKNVREKPWVVRSSRIYLFVSQIKKIFFVDVHRMPRSPFKERLSLWMPSIQLYSKKGYGKLLGKTWHAFEILYPSYQVSDHTFNFIDK